MLAFGFRLSSRQRAISVRCQTTKIMKAKYYYKGQEVELVPNQQFSDMVGVKRPVPGFPGNSEVIHVDPKELTSTQPTAAVEAEPDKLDINTASLNRAVAKLPGLSRKDIRTILSRRPDKGYRDMEHLASVCEGLRIEWDAIADRLSFHQQKKADPEKVETQEDRENLQSETESQTPKKTQAPTKKRRGRRKAQAEASEAPPDLQSNSAPDEGLTPEE